LIFFYDKMKKDPGHDNEEEEEEAEEIENG